MLEESVVLSEERREARAEQLEDTTDAAELAPDADALRLVRERENLFRESNLNRDPCKDLFKQR